MAMAHGCAAERPCGAEIFRPDGSAPYRQGWVFESDLTSPLARRRSSRPFARWGRAWRDLLMCISYLGKRAAPVGGPWPLARIVSCDVCRVSSIATLCEVTCCGRTRKIGRAGSHAAALCGHCRGPHPEVAHRAAVCARPARPRMPSSTTTSHPDVRCSAAAQKCAHEPDLPGWCKRTHRTPARCGMAMCARCVPTF